MLIAVENWTPRDRTYLQEMGWYKGLSADKPLWKLYAKIPEDADLDLEGQYYSIKRLGRIFRPGMKLSIR